MNPNDKGRIKIPRDYKWSKHLYFTTLAKYNNAMRMWKSGTGGGPGKPEDYARWQLRDPEDFATYGGTRGGIRMDYLAYIYMLDKGIGFALNTINDPPPEETILEDGVERNIGVTKGGGTKRKFLEDIDDVLQKSTASFNEMFGESLAVQKKLAASLENIVGNEKMEDEKEARMEKLERLLDIIEKLEVRLEKAKKMPER